MAEVVGIFDAAGQPCGSAVSLSRLPVTPSNFAEPMAKSLWGLDLSGPHFARVGVPGDDGFARAPPAEGVPTRRIS